MCFSAAVCIQDTSACEVAHVPYEEQEPKQQQKNKVKTVNMKKSFSYDLQEQQWGIMMIFFKKKKSICTL